VEEYVWVASSALIHRRIAVGGAPQASQNPTFRRNVFWALTCTVQDRERHGVPSDVDGCYAKGIEPTRFVFENAPKHLYGTIKRHTNQLLGKAGFAYDKRGRLAYHRLLSATIISVWRAFEQIRHHVEALRHRPAFFGCDMKMSNKFEWHTDALDVAVGEVGFQMEVLAFMVSIDRDILKDHLRWLQEVFGFSDTRALCFDDNFFRD